MLEAVMNISTLPRRYNLLHVLVQSFNNYQILTDVEVYLRKETACPQEITSIMSPGYHRVYTETEVNICVIIISLYAN